MTDDVHNNPPQINFGVGSQGTFEYTPQMNWVNTSGTMMPLLMSLVPVE